MDYMTRFLIGAAQLVCRDKEVQASEAYFAIPGPEASGELDELFARAAEKGYQKGRQEAWGEASALIERVCLQADKVGL